ncbi:MAG: hypothetical protein AB3N63_13540 [Puniceicoccaceae bacterium]
MGCIERMKTTMEIPDSLFRRAKARAAARGQSMASFINGAIEARLRDEDQRSSDKPWMAFAGMMESERGLLERLDRRIEESCGVVDEGEWT